MKTYNLTTITFVLENLNPRDSAYEVFKTLKRFSETPSLWRERIHHRSELKRLIKVGSHMVRDVGLTWEDAQLEAKKSFWQD